MKKFWLRYKFVIIAFFLWRVALWGIELAAPSLWPLRAGFLDPVRWANMDGGHYLFIARSGYGLYEQAFFPLYPVLIRVVSFLPVPLPYVGLLISHAAFFMGLLLFYDLAEIFDKKYARWSVAFLLSFSTSFFFAAVYSTSLYFLFAVAAMWAIEKRRWVAVGILGAFGSATRIFGVFLVVPAIIEYIRNTKKVRVRDLTAIGLIPVGLVIYMLYVYIKTGDAFAFAHVLPAYGSQRSGGAIVLLPQVVWRYGKIMFTANPATVEYGIAMFEFTVFFLFVCLLVRACRVNINKSFVLYAAVVLFLPTLTGTLTSMPRYVLDAFPLFIVLGMTHNTPVKTALLVLMLVGMVICTSLYLQGYFVA